MRTALSPAAAAALVPDGATVMIGGFMGVGSPHRTIAALVARGVRGLTVVANDTARPGVGVGKLITAGCVARVTASHVGTNPETQRLMLAGELDVELVPQGTLAERIRAGGAGIPAFFTKTGVGTLIAEGKELREFDGETYVMERGLVADLSIVHAWKGDREGNLVYRKTARNFNPMMASAGRVTVAEVEQLVEPGEIDPDQIVTPGIFIKRMVHVQNPSKRIEQRTVRKRAQAAAPAGAGEEV
jgi:3-oxoacid CoA-transferase subunit A